MAQILTVKGGTNAIVEYIGPGARTFSCTGKATITNMGAEIGATTSMFPYDERMGRYLRGTGRAALVPLVDATWTCWRRTRRCEADPEKHYDQVVAHRPLSAWSPTWWGPHTPDLARPVSQIAAKDARDNNVSLRAEWPPSSGAAPTPRYEDISRAADIAEQASAKGAKTTSPLLITPGSEQIYRTIQRDGQMASLEKVGGTVMANACGPCIGQWKRDDVKKGEVNSIITLLQPQLPRPQRRQRRHHELHRLARGGHGRRPGGAAGVNPFTEEFTGAPGQARAGAAAAPDDCPRTASCRHAAYVAPPADGSKVQIIVDPKSDRLQLLSPLTPGTARTSSICPLLLKAKGKCTTDHISPAGPWLNYRGHLDKITDNMFLGAISAFTGKPGPARTSSAARAGDPQTIARDYKATGLKWVAIGDENYGEGSSREHAAMSPRHLGGGRGHRAQLRPHPRVQPEEAGPPGADFSEPGGLRPHPRRRSSEPRRVGGNGAGPAGRVPDQARRRVERDLAPQPYVQRIATRMVSQRFRAEPLPPLSA